MALPIYALTLFVSAFILFLVQPIVGKIILPKLGGTPQVWNTCMVFFQMVLLAGYAYTHNATTRLTLRQQLIAHGALLLLPLTLLLPFPFAIGGADMVDGMITNPNSLWGFVPDLGSNPIPSTLAVLFAYVALPFLVVATSAPLLQKWFVHTGHPAARDPYFLYGASNFGSMSSLIVYPLFIEPYVSLTNQGWTYAIGYITLIAFMAVCAGMVWNAKDAFLPKAAPAPEPKPEPAPAAAQASAPDAQTGIAAGAPAAAPTAPAATSVKAGAPGKHGKGAHGAGRSHAPAPSVAVANDDMNFARRFRWVMLAAIPSSLMLGITTHITTDLSPQPMFWLIPLILYLGSFILVFARWPVVWTETPHVVFLYAQVLFLPGMIMSDVWNLASDPSLLKVAIFAHVMGFFTTTMVCHGELAKDRPSTRFLTEFYLWMSVGGMVGGMFNALIAPVIFPKYWEFPLAIFAAALARPKMFDIGLGDNFLASLFESQPEAPVTKQKGGKHHHAPVSIGVTANESLVRNLDFVWPGVILALTLIAGLVLPRDMSHIVRNLFQYGIPLVLCMACFSRPFRFGLGIGAVLLLHVIFVAQAESEVTLKSSRSYFGAISVKQMNRGFGPYRQLIHGHIDHGMNYLVPEKKADRGDPAKDRSRLATTYYHREGPAGRVMEKFNWSKGDPNTFHADARLPASLIFNALADVGVGNLPLTELVTAWSEPPIATIGLGTGTMASYGRPYQHVHFYEIDNQVQRLSFAAPTREFGNWLEYGKAKQKSSRTVYFNYLEQALERGAAVQVLMGDARLRMNLPYENHYLDNNGQPRTDETDRGGGPNNFYHMMVVDAFSSDAIPAHLLTREAFKMYFSKLTKDGILCVHTSNRFVDLPLVVSAVSADLGFAHLRGHDINDNHSEGHYTSEWVMVARTSKDLAHLTGDSDFLRAYKTAIGRKNRSDPYWETVASSERYVWTDDYYNLLSVVRWR
ncbi:MAG: hypothetical protein HYX68_10975 [Planctomycetes bacterium]|nr:hypothetical protein [Planctomycetota bacterium]